MKLLFITKRQIVVFSTLALVLGTTLALNGGRLADVVSTLAPNKEVPIYCVDTTDKKASLSFDAAWGNEDTQSLIDILGKYDVKATFFVVGDWVDKYPASVKALSDAGHEIMNHSNTHAHYPQLSKEEIMADALACGEKIEKITGKKANLLRPPYGDYDDKTIQALREIGYYGIQWDVDSLDWKDLPASEINQRVTGKVKEGSIVLFHNAAKNTPEALPGIIENLQSKGFALIPISELIYKENYEMDHTGKQIFKGTPTSPASLAPASVDFQ